MDRIYEHLSPHSPVHKLCAAVELLTSVNGDFISVPGTRDANVPTYVLYIAYSQGPRDRAHRTHKGIAFCNEHHGCLLTLWVQALLGAVKIWPLPASVIADAVNAEYVATVIYQRYVPVAEQYVMPGPVIKGDTYNQRRFSLGTPGPPNELVQTIYYVILPSVNLAPTRVAVRRLDQQRAQNARPCSRENENSPLT